MYCFSFHANMLYGGISITFYWDCLKWRSRHLRFIRTILSQAQNLVQSFTFCLFFSSYVYLCITFYSSSANVLGEEVDFQVLLSQLGHKLKNPVQNFEFCEYLDAFQLSLLN